MAEKTEEQVLLEQTKAKLQNQKLRQQISVGKGTKKSVIEKSLADERLKSANAERAEIAAEVARGRYIDTSLVRSSVITNTAVLIAALRNIPVAAAEYIIMNECSSEIAITAAIAKSLEAALDKYQSEQSTIIPDE